MAHKRKDNSENATKNRSIHKYSRQVSEIKQRGVITEREVNLVRRRLNSGGMKYEDTTSLEGMKITSEQTTKGLDWLKDKWKTPKGKVRKNNPFGWREEETIDSFQEFRLNSFTNNITGIQAQIGVNNWIAVWDVIGKNTRFQYIMEAGKPKIIG